MVTNIEFESSECRELTVFESIYLINNNRQAHPTDKCVPKENHGSPLLGPNAAEMYPDKSSSMGQEIDFRGLIFRAHSLFEITSDIAFDLILSSFYHANV